MSSQGTSSQNVTGQVKWFNSRAGYGFLTVTDGEKKGTDVFVHHSRINVAQEQYKYLVQGEYVEFTVSPTEEGVAHEYQASDIKGMNSGKLMCETRFENRRPRRPRRNDKDGEVEENVEEEVKKTKPRTNRGGGGPRENQTNSQRRSRNKGAKKAQEQEQDA